ncbi:MAG: DUF1570 domain-containing protein [Planctomycetia bacterium]|nr:DUF1570 domain-containing protein [Planctomycetia bacterium]
MIRATIFLLGLWLAVPLWGLDTVVWKETEDAAERRTVGRTLVVAQDGGLLLQERTGEIHAIEPQMIVRATRNSKPFVPMTREEVAEVFRERLPEDFAVHTTAHYTIFYNTSQDYARWCGQLMERLYSTFQNFWAKRDYELPEPEFPLIVIVFSHPREYREYAREEVGEVGDTIIGYYSYKTNRIVCSDLSGQETYGTQRPATMTMGAITREILSRPQAVKQVATIIHEATHQIAYNRGLCARYGDVPLWFNEGIAMYFEAPDIRSDKGWRAIGKINPLRYSTFMDSLSNYSPGFLRKMLTDDDVFRRSETSGEAYAQAWALTWFLLKTRQKDYIRYAQQFSEKKMLVWDSPEKRLMDVERIFGSVEKLESDFVRYMRKMRR